MRAAKGPLLGAATLNLRGGKASPPRGRTDFCRPTTGRGGDFTGPGSCEPSSVGRALSAEVKDLIGAVRGPVGRRRRCRFVRVDRIRGCNGCVVRRRLKDQPQYRPRGLEGSAA